MNLVLVVRVLSALVFVGFGVASLVSPAVELEFERYGVPQLRVLTGVMEVAGGLGLLFGPTPRWVAAAAAGLCVLMLGALVVRVRIEDPWYALLPAAVLLVANAWLAMRMWLHAARADGRKPEEVQARRCEDGETRQTQRGECLPMHRALVQRSTGFHGQHGACSQPAQHE